LSEGRCVYRRAGKKLEKRRERDGTTQRWPREPWIAGGRRVVRLSRHYLDRAIKRRQRRVHRGTDSSARTDSRINDSDVPWRNAFRKAKRRATSKCDCSAFRTAEFSERGGGARARVVTLQTNSICSMLTLTRWTQLEHPTDVSRDVRHTCAPREVTWSPRIRPMILCDFSRDRRATIPIIGVQRFPTRWWKFFRVRLKPDMRAKREMPSVAQSRSHDGTAKLEKSPGFVDGNGSCYERCETRSRGNGSAIERDSLSIPKGIILRCDSFASEKRTERERERERKRRRQSAASETRLAIEEEQVKQG